MIYASRVCVLSVCLALASVVYGGSGVSEVTCAEIKFSEAAEARDRAAFKQLIDADARFVAGKVLKGPQAVAEAWEPFFVNAGPRISWRPLIVEVVAEGGLALSSGPYKIESVNAEGESVVAWGTYNSVWRRNELGEWKVLFDAGGDHGKTPSAEELALFDRESGCPEEPTG